MRTDLGISQTLFSKPKQYYVVLNDTYFIKISKRQYDMFKEFMNSEEKKTK